VITWKMAVKTEKKSKAQCDVLLEGRTCERWTKVFFLANNKNWWASSSTYSWL